MDASAWERARIAQRLSKGKQNPAAERPVVRRQDTRVPGETLRDADLDAPRGEAGEPSREGEGCVGVRGEEPAEVPRREHEAVDIGRGDDRRGPRAPADRTDLAERVAGLQA